MFKPVGVSHENNKDNRSFLSLPFLNKGLDAIFCITNLLMNTYLPISKIKVFPVISYTYASTIAPKVFNYKQVLRDFQINDLKAKPPDCCCKTSPFNYSPSGHVITGDLNIVENDLLRDVLAKGPKYREPRRINWNHNFKQIMDSVEDYARKWAKREKEKDIDVLSEWVKAVRSLVLKRINSLKSSMSTKTTSIFNNADVVKTLSTLHDKYVVVPADKAPNNIIFVCKKTLH